MEFTQEKIDAAKKAHGDVFLIEFEGGHSALLKKPTRQQLGYAMSAANDPIKKTEILITSCWIEGDDIIKSDPGLLVGAAPQLDAIIEVKSAEIKKL